MNEVEEKQAVTSGKPRWTVAEFAVAVFLVFVCVMMGLTVWSVFLMISGL